jgi:hypothetical protein
MAGSVRQATYNKPGLLTVSSGSASTGGSLAIQQETSEGWTGIFVDYEPYTGWGLWHDNGNNFFSFTSEVTAGNIRSFAVPSRVSGNRTAYEKFRVDQNNGDTIAGGIGYANASFRAPIFYDSNNTAFYIDPASSSIVNNLTVNGTLTYSGALSVEGAEVLTTNLNTSIGNQGWDLNGNYAMQAIYGNHNPLNNGNVYNAALFKGTGWTMYGFNGSSWVNLGTVPNLTSGYGKANWGGVTLSRSYSQFIIDCGSSFGYQFMSALTLTHSTSGNSMSVYFEKSTSATYNSGTWTTMASATGVGSWPGGTSIKFSDVVGASYPPYVRLRIIPSWSHPSNTISLGQLFVSAAYGGGNQLLEWDSSYNVTANGSFRAPIFYDSNDTNYYVDANSNSRLVNLGLGGVTPDIRLSVSGDGHFSGVIHLGGTAGSYNSWGSRDYTTSGLRYFNARNYQFNNFGYGSTYTIDIDTSGNLIASNSVRAPIFYDSNNTAYYTDQAGTSNYFNLQISGASNKYLYITPGNGYEAMVRYNGGSGSGWYVGKRISSQVVGTESFHFYSEAAGQTVGGIDTSGNIFARDSVRAPIFYDNNDTGYYMDPNSTAANCARFAGGIHVSVGNVTGSGIILADDGDIVDLNDGYCAMRFSLGMRVHSGNRSGGAVHTLHSDGNAYFNSSARAPIFYDQNDTGFYTDPTSTSRIRAIRVASAVQSSSYGEAAIEVREFNYGGVQGDIFANYPRIGFHWGGRVASSIAMGSNGWINIMNNPGTGWENIRANQGLFNSEVTAYYSDVRLKTKVGTIDNAVEKIKSIETFKYVNNELANSVGFTDKLVHVGVSAQSVEAVFPEVVRHAPFDIKVEDGKEVSESGEWYKTVQYDKLVPLLIEAIKEQQTTIDQLRADMQELKELVKQSLGK